MLLLDQQWGKQVFTSECLSAVRPENLLRALKEVDLRPKACVVLEHFSSKDWHILVQAQVPFGLQNL